MQALRQLLAQFVAFVPNLLGALVILAVGYLVTRIITTILRRLLALIGVDRLGERLMSVDVVARSGVEVSLSAILAQVIYYFLMLVVLVAATDVLGMEVVSNLVSSAIEYIPNLVAALVILVLGAIFADVMRGMARVAFRSLGLSGADLLASVVFWFVFVAIGVTALSQAQLETDFIVTNLSVVVGGVALAFALAYGLAARPLMGGFLAQFYNRGKINVGDRIRIGGEEGRVLGIDRASFTLAGEGDRLAIVPLSRLQTDTVVVLERAATGDPLLDQHARPRG